MVQDEHGHPPCFISNTSLSISIEHTDCVSAGISQRNYIIISERKFNHDDDNN